MSEQFALAVTLIGTLLTVLVPFLWLGSNKRWPGRRDVLVTLFFLVFPIAMVTALTFVMPLLLAGAAPE